MPVLCMMVVLLGPAVDHVRGVLAVNVRMRLDGLRGSSVVRL